jgi:hypothetical protein
MPFPLAGDGGKARPEALSMRALRSLLGIVALAVVAPGTGAASGCLPCQFHGDCGEARVPCLPSEARCMPNGGILVFNSVAPNVPAYWTLYARRNRPPGELIGKLKVFADEVLGPPSVPGFPGRCRRGTCFGRTGRFAGTMTGDRLTGVATYRSGAACDFSMTVAWGYGDPEPNTFTCRNAAGDVTSQGAIQLQGIRLFGCQQ